MALTGPQKHAARRIFFKLLNGEGDRWGKNLLNDVSDALIAWKDANGASLNTALPVGFRGAGSTADEKAAALISTLAAERGLEI